MQFSDLETFKVGFSIDPLQQGEAILQNSPGYEGFQGTVDQSSRGNQGTIFEYLWICFVHFSRLYFSFLN
jgi:hypothetical protein